MSVIAELPDIRPSLLLDFANSRRVHPLLQCTRASTATCYGPDGKLRVVESNVPRIEFDPLSGKCLGLLAEEARTNFILHSSNFGNALWTKSGPISVTPEADSWWDISHNGTGNYAGIYQAGRPNTNKFATFSFDVRPGSLSAASMFLGFNGTADAARVTFDFVAGTSALASVVGVITSAMVSHSIKNMGGFWRITLSVDASSTSITPASNVCYLYTGGVVSAQVAGNIKARRSQLESATFSTSHIETADAAVTRAGDAVSLIVPQLPSDGYTICIDASINWVGEYPVILSDNSTGLGNYVGIRAAAAGSYINSAEGGRSGIASPRPAAGAPFKMAAAISNDASKGLIAVDGVLSAVTSARTAADFSLRNILKLGAVTGAAQGMNLIRRVAIYPRVLTGPQLQRLAA